MKNPVKPVKEKSFMGKWGEIESYLTKTNEHIPQTLLNHLEKAYKDTTPRQEQEQIINEVYKDIFKR